MIGMFPFGLHLRRITSGGSWIAEIDGLRFVAICSVVLFHLFGELTQSHASRMPIQPRYEGLASILEHGDRGVRLFFVISGLILCRPFRDQHRYSGKRVSLRYYFLRRVTRLEPPNVLVLLLWAATIVAYFHTPLMNVLEHLLASMFYVHSLIYRAGSTINFVTWSLEVEIQFYLLAPLIAGVFLIRNSAWRRPLLLAGVIVPGILQMHAGPFQQLTIVFYIQYFLAGYLLCDLLPRGFSRGSAEFPVGRRCCCSLGSHFRSEFRVDHTRGAPDADCDCLSGSFLWSGWKLGLSATMDRDDRGYVLLHLPHPLLGHRDLLQAHSPSEQI
jgi:peptidoglycan/LPS O-acetylase OafA/YrhL